MRARKNPPLGVAVFLLGAWYALLLPGWLPDWLSSVANRSVGNADGAGNDGSNADGAGNDDLVMSRVEQTARPRQKSPLYTHHIYTSQ